MENMLLPEIWQMIYKHLHKYKWDMVNIEYQEKFKNNWDDTQLYFYDEQRDRLLAMFRGYIHLNGDSEWSFSSDTTLWYKDDTFVSNVNEMMTDNSWGKLPINY
jgi:hypothetical protein